MRKDTGSITKEMLQFLTKNHLSPESYKVMNFTSNRGLPTYESSHGQVNTCSSRARLMPIKKTSKQSNGLKHKTSVEKTVLRQHKNVCYTDNERLSVIANQDVLVYSSGCSSSISSGYGSPGDETS